MVGVHGGGLGGVGVGCEGEHFTYYASGCGIGCAVYIYK